MASFRMARAMTVAPRNVPWVHTSRGRPLAWVQHRFDIDPHLSSHACRSSPCDASETAFLLRVVQQKTDTDQPSSQQFLAPLAAPVVRPKPVPVDRKSTRLNSSHT